MENRKFLELTITLITTLMLSSMGLGLYSMSLHGRAIAAERQDAVDRRALVILSARHQSDLRMYGAWIAAQREELTRLSVTHAPASPAPSTSHSWW